MKRIDAANAGLTRYVSDKPCRAGHISERYTSTGNCIACQMSVRQRLVQARIGKALGWAEVSAEVPEDQVRLLRSVVDVLRRHGPLAQQMRSALDRAMVGILEMDPHIHVSDCLRVTPGTPRNPADLVPPKLAAQEVSNGEPDWHRDEGYRSLIPAAFRGAL